MSTNRLSKVKRIIVISILVILVVIQFVPALPESYEPDENKTFAEVYEVPDEVHSILKSACFDCHSHQSKWPWYSKIAPLSFWIGDHVEHGRKHLDFSQWGSYSEEKAAHKLEEIVEEVKGGEMPLESYTWIHSEARLSEPERLLLVEYVNGLRN